MKPFIAAILLAAFGIFFVRLGLRQIKTGVAWTNLGGMLYYPITRGGAPLLYWPAVTASFFFGIVMLLIAASMLFG